MWTTHALVWIVTTISIAFGIVGFTIGQNVGSRDAFFSWVMGRVWVEFTYPADAVRAAKDEGGIMFLGPGRHLWFKEPHEIPAGVEIRGWSQQDSRFRVLFPEKHP